MVAGGVAEVTEEKKNDHIAAENWATMFVIVAKVNCLTVSVAPVDL